MDVVLSNNGHTPVPLLRGELGMCAGAIGPGEGGGGWLGGAGGQRAELKLPLFPPWISLGKACLLGSVTGM